VAGKPAADLARSLAALQDALGEIHDAAVAERWLRVASAHVDPPASFVAGLLAAGVRGRSAAERQEWQRLWRAARRKKLVRRIK
jgi:CHAD domain-containing protein